MGSSAPNVCLLISGFCFVVCLLPGCVEAEDREVVEPLIELNSVNYSDFSRGQANCFLDTAEIPLNESRQRLLEGAAIDARALAGSFNQAIALAEVGKQYACLGQREMANILLEEALALTDDVRKTHNQVRLLLEVAGIYGEQLEHLDRMDALFTDAIVVASTTIENSTTHAITFRAIIDQYTLMKDYSSVRVVVDLIEDPPTRKRYIQSAMSLIEISGSTDDLTRFLSFFPEGDSLVRMGDNSDSSE